MVMVTQNVVTNSDGAQGIIVDGLCLHTNEPVISDMRPTWPKYVPVEPANQPYRFSR